MVRDPLNRPVRAFLAAAAVANLLAITAGLGAGAAYLGGGQLAIAAAFRQHRAVHVVFAIAWIYLAGVAAVYHALGHRPPPGLGRRARWHLGLWGLSGVGALASLCVGSFSGRLYLEAPALWSLPSIAGWLILAATYAGWFRARTSPVPVHALMWALSLALFPIAFAEAHAHLSPQLAARPVRDLTVQWKSYGALVGTFNLLVYGAVAYVGTLRAKDGGAPASPLAFALFALGALNTLTNYGHHTFHLAQAPLVHWTGFLVSMSELVILFAVLDELLRGVRPDAGDVTARLLRWGKFWTGLMLALAILLSIPPVNTLAHGTYLVMAHAMGSMIGIDTVLLLACIHELLARGGCAPSGAGRAVARAACALLNLGLTAILVALLARGTADAVLRALGPLAPCPPDLLRHWQTVFVSGGAAVALAMAVLDVGLIRATLSARSASAPSSAPGCG